MTKRELLAQLARGEGALANARDDEPVFVLVGHDRLAPATVAYWVLLAIDAGVAAPKWRGAEVEADAMRAWQAANPALTKLPD